MPSTPKSLRILMIEDEPNDVILINDTLSGAGLTCRTQSVVARDEFLREIASAPPDLILSDHGSPSFDGFAALALAHERCPGTPFIFVADSIDEREACDARRRGAFNWVPKSQLAALGPVVHEALAHAEERARHQQTERELHEAQDRLHLLTRELASTEALLVALEPLVAAMKAPSAPGEAERDFSPGDIAALRLLKLELERQEEALKHEKAALREREGFVEQGETMLLRKVQAQQERETELDQREEDLVRLLGRCSPASAKSPDLITAALAQSA
jgi:CheY-like chemotaxis protein